MEITELQKIKEERTDNYSVDPDNWEKEQEYIHQHKGVFYKNYESWKNHVKFELLEYIDKVLRYKPIEDDTKLGGKVLSALGISKDLIFFGKPTNLLKDTDSDYVKLRDDEANVYCPMCSYFGLPAYHPIREWVRIYPSKDGSSMYNGECKLFVDPRNELRVDGNYDGCIGGFSEKIVIEAYKLEELHVPSKASIVDEYYSKTKQCYITGEIAVNPQKEHFYTSALGHAYIIYHRDGRYENNIMKASKTANQSKSDTMPEEFLPEERYKAALKSNNFGKIPETLADGRNAYAVDLVRKHIKKLMEYVNKERVHKEAKIRWIENFIR